MSRMENRFQVKCRLQPINSDFLEQCDDMDSEIHLGSVGKVPFLISNDYHELKGRLLERESHIYAIPLTRSP